jgi:hypothetical protein
MAIGSADEMKRGAGLWRSTKKVDPGCEEGLKIFYLTSGP